MLRRRSFIVVVLCAAVGAAAGIAGTAAAPKQKAQSSASRAHGVRHHGPGRFGGPPVHVEAVVLNRAGDKFITLTEDSGTVKSVSGDELTIAEAFGDVKYKDVTLTIPSDAKIQRNFDEAKLGDLKEGDRVHVASSSDGTYVFAVDPDSAPPRHRFGGPHRGGPHRGGPPPF